MLIPVVKALHIISVIAWMAGLLYLPRLMVYHADVPGNGAQSHLFMRMERRLLRLIMNPAMIVSWIFGLWLAIEGDYWREGWFVLKLACAAGLTLCHGYFARCVKEFAAHNNRHTARFFRIVNEIPTVFMIAIVFLVVLKPF